MLPIKCDCGHQWSNPKSLFDHWEKDGCTTWEARVNLSKQESLEWINEGNSREYPFYPPVR